MVAFTFFLILLLMYRITILSSFSLTLAHFNSHPLHPLPHCSTPLFSSFTSLATKGYLSHFTLAPWSCCFSFWIAVSFTNHQFVLFYYCIDRCNKLKFIFIMHTYTMNANFCCVYLSFIHKKKHIFIMFLGLIHNENAFPLFLLCIKKIIWFF